jgi:hypothetical protein
MLLLKGDRLRCTAFQDPAMILLAPFLIVLADDPAPAPTVPQSLLKFARANVGQKVGNGECASLVLEGLREAGVRPRISQGGVEWGEPVDSLEETQPGDVLQFSNATFVQKKKLPKGGTFTQTWLFPRHTAIVSSRTTEKGKTIIKLLHQNAGTVDEPEEERRKVREWELDLADLKEGTIKAYRPGRD